MDSLLDELFAAENGRVLYRGYVDDPRNTDHAWMETTAFHFHCNAECAKMLKLWADLPFTDGSFDASWRQGGARVIHDCFQQGFPGVPRRLQMRLHGLRMDQDDAERVQLGQESPQDGTSKWPR